MTKKERTLIFTILIGIIIVVLIDLFSDFKEGARWWHLTTEGSIALFAMGGIFILMKDTFKLKQNLENERKNVEVLKDESLKWRNQAKKYIEGLSSAIDSQLDAWKLSAAEKDVAFLLLKGLSLKEIAGIRNTTEKTARAHSVAVYYKSGLSGRSELAAFFLEDLFVP